MTEDGLHQAVTEYAILEHSNSSFTVMIWRGEYIMVRGIPVWQATTPYVVEGPSAFTAFQGAIGLELAGAVRAFALLLAL